MKRRTAKSREQYQQKVCAHVLACYVEIKTVSGTMSCSGFYKRLGGTAAPANGTLRVSDSDLIADVELVLARVLGDRWEELVEAEEVTPSMTLAIGKELLRRKIYPIHAYMKPKVAR